ncbi:MAG: hypothetical protein N4R13_08025 [Lactobacillus crispatus]|nr:hypothetical protein [Lactobacillus crispatus]MCT7816742.1 hypothetical protein [Lactobacillus crispatus]
MNEKITANQFCHEMLIATKKHLITHTDFKIGNNPNFLYYVPKLFTTEIEGPNGEDAKVAQAFFNTWNYLQGHPDNQKNVPSKLIEEIEFTSSAAMSMPKAFALNIEARLFNEQAQVLADYSIKGLKFGTPAPNKACMYPYISNGHKRYYGIMLPYPNLEAKNTYRLEIIEHYTLNVNGKEGNFTRKIIVPISVGNTGNRHFAEFVAGKKIYNILQYSSFEFYNRKPDDWKSSLGKFNNKVEWYHDCSYTPDHVQEHVMGKQTIWFGDSVVPSLMMAVSNIVQPIILNRFNGNDEDFFYSVLKYVNQIDSLTFDSLTQLNNEYLAQSLTLASDGLAKSLIASTVNAKFKPSICNKELNHNGLGCSNVNIFNMIYSKGNRHLSMTDELPYLINSRYDFEELTPEIVVNAVN